MQITDHQIQKLLSDACVEVSKLDSNSIKDGDAFENKIYDILCSISKGTGINVIRTSKQAFPDIIIGDFGVEVKFTKENKWTSTGNSIYQKTFDTSVKNTIYMFFGCTTKVKNYEARFKKYEECLFDINVTHSPRFAINMNLSEEESIFPIGDITYTEYSTKEETDKTKIIKKILKKKYKKDKAWFLEEEEIVSSPVLKDFSDLETKEQKKLLVESFVLFPEIIASKYKGVAIHLIEKHSVFSHCLRDKFTAKGKGEIVVNDVKHEQVPRRYITLQELMPAIKKYIKTEDNKKMILEYWNTYDIGEFTEDHIKLKSWLKLLEHFHDNAPEKNKLPRRLTISDLSKKS